MFRSELSETRNRRRLLQKGEVNGAFSIAEIIDCFEHTKYLLFEAQGRSQNSGGERRRTRQFYYGWSYSRNYNLELYLCLELEAHSRSTRIDLQAAYR
ncbi:hypothetical protein L596_002792 [Steinernema carpocapsae]|uniref:Uncharacterized protein n=1 Tax=Steinernema carpocapsae TaxID=34508 RepID=A0A4U8UT66_STECR|nr:hypothetical protein L596_002792 [Steinernema carpocapsae]